MALDLDQIAIQIEGMADNIKLREKDGIVKLGLALDILRSPSVELEQLNEKIKQSKSTWLVPELKERIDCSQSVMPCPEDYTVIATDGSNIDADRHYSIHCFLINIGVVQLRYGRNPDARLFSVPRLYFDDSEVVISSEDGKQILIEGQLLGLKRGDEECRLLAQGVRELEDGLPVLLMVDGSLILWGLAGQTYPEFVIQELLTDGLLKYFDEINNYNVSKQIALASYISFPRSTEIVNALRLAVCPYSPVDCDYYCSGKFHDRECDRVAGLRDRDIFNSILKTGERSAIFKTRSSIVEKYYGDHQINFFYIKLDEEVARIEVPSWVPDNPQLLNFLHSMIIDQCKRGLGYPVALSEAHEKAVITGADREQFWRLVDQNLVEDNIMLKSSAKQQSKRTRWI
jgi:hypothetical protein